MTAIIEWNPRILNDKPVIKGTRIPVSLIYELAGLGYTSKQIIDEYPTLTEEVVNKVLEIGQLAVSNLMTSKAQKVDSLEPQTT